MLAAIPIIGIRAAAVQIRNFTVLYLNLHFVVLGSLYFRPIS